MASKVDHSLSQSIHSRLSSSSESSSDSMTPDTSDASCSSEGGDISRRICHSARMRGRRHAVDHGRETPIPPEDLEQLMTRHHGAQSTQAMEKTKKSSSSSTTVSQSTRKMRANCTSVSSGK